LVINKNYTEMHGQRNIKLHRTLDLLWTGTTGRFLSIW